mmetsp:Transcript_26115/g.57068  ORF Transcript_26115/g.57068 Transcript_26115/m.57068 type:complete len:236 (-) Transcript_26115:322-1029(-)
MLTRAFRAQRMQVLQSEHCIQRPPPGVGVGVAWAVAWAVLRGSHSAAERQRPLIHCLCTACCMMWSCFSRAGVGSQAAHLGHHSVVLARQRLASASTVQQTRIRIFAQLGSCLRLAEQKWTENGTWHHENQVEGERSHDAEAVNQSPRHRTQAAPTNGTPQAISAVLPLLCTFANHGSIHHDGHWTEEALRHHTYGQNGGIGGGKRQHEAYGVGCYVQQQHDLPVRPQVICSQRG